MVDPIERNGMIYTPLFRTHFMDQERDSIYYLNKETGMGYRIKFDGWETNEIFIGMITQENRICGGYEIIDYIRKHNGIFPFFVPVLGIGIVEEFNHMWSIGRGEKTLQDIEIFIKQRLVYPCGLNFYDEHPFRMSDVVESLGRERIIFKKDLSQGFRFHYGHNLVEMYDTYNPLDYLRV